MLPKRGDQKEGWQKLKYIPGIPVHMVVSYIIGVPRVFRERSHSYKGLEGWLDKILLKEFTLGFDPKF